MSNAVTRKEAYLKSIGNGTSSALKPITREEQYLAYIAGESNSFPTNPITREEALLDKIAKSGVSGGGNGGGSGGGGDDITKGLIEKTLTEVSHDTAETLGEYIFYNTPLTKARFPKVKTMQQYAFCEDKQLESVYAPLVEEIGGYCFANTKALKGIDFPNLKQIISNAFMGSAITEINFPSAVSVAQSSFQGCASLESVNLPNATNVQSAAFRSCSALVNVNLPKPTRLYSSAFSGCTALKNIVLPATAVFEGSVFENCYSLEKVDLPNATNLGAKVFSNCYSLKTIILRKVGHIVVLGNAHSLQNCYHIHGTVDATYNPNGEKDGYIYVPKVYLEEYKNATNWSAVASQLRAIEDYPEITGG